jgi:hypothetical protein
LEGMWYGIGVGQPMELAPEFLMRMMRRFQNSLKPSLLPNQVLPALIICNLY